MRLVSPRLTQWDRVAGADSRQENGTLGAAANLDGWGDPPRARSTEPGAESRQDPSSSFSTVGPMVSGGSCFPAAETNALPGTVTAAGGTWSAKPGTFTLWLVQGKCPGPGVPTSAPSPFGARVSVS